MKLPSYTENEIAGAPDWLANEMRSMNLCGYYLKSARQFIFLGYVGIFIAIFLIFTNKLLLSLAANALGIISTHVGARYNRKVKKLNRQSRYFKGE